MGELRNYASDEVKVAWPPTLSSITSLEKGLAQGTFIRETRAAPAVSYKPDGVGGAVTMFGANFTGKLVMTFDRESREHTILMGLANLDQATKSVVGPLFITDKNTGLVQLYNAARIEMIPNYQAGTGPSVAPWTFLYGRAIGQQFGGNNNLVG